MSNEITLYPIDDNQNKLLYISAAINSLNNETEQTGTQWRNGLDKLSDKKLFSKAATTWKSTKKAHNGEDLNKVAMDLILNKENIEKIMEDPTGIILLDLNLNGWNSNSAEEKKINFFEEPYANLSLAEPETRLESYLFENFRFAAAILKMALSSSKPVFFMSIADVKAIAYAQEDEGITNLVEIPMSYIYDDDKLGQVIKEFFEKFSDYFPRKFHENESIDNALKMYSTMCPDGENTWYHENSDGDGFNTNHEKTVKNWLQEFYTGTTPFKIESAEIKALTMVFEKGMSWPYENQSITNPFYSPKRNNVSPTTLGLVSKALELPFAESFPADCPTSMDKTTWWNLPIAPGLAFFIALKEFIWILEKKTPAKLITCERVEGDQGLKMYSILFQLAKKPSREPDSSDPPDYTPFQLANNYIKNRFDEGGCEVTKALKNLLFSRIDKNKRIKDLNVEWIQIFTSEKLDTPFDDKPDGGLCPPVGVCFYPYGLRLVWAAGGVKANYDED